MIERLNRLAIWLYPARIMLLLLALLSLGVSIYILVGGAGTLAPYLMPAIAVCGWSFCLYGIAEQFKQVPEPVIAGDGFWRRCKKRCLRAICWIWVLCTILCSLLLLYSSYKVIGFAVNA